MPYGTPWAMPQARCHQVRQAAPLAWDGGRAGSKLGHVDSEIGTLPALRLIKKPSGSFALVRMRHGISGTTRVAQPFVGRDRAGKTGR
jgi:hypothetical protein